MAESDEKVPVENIPAGTVVQAVTGGPKGIVMEREHTNWTSVTYAGRTMQYRHGETRLYIAEAEIRRTHTAADWDRLRRAAGQALERIEVAERDAGGAVAEAEAILTEVVELNGTYKRPS